MKPLAPLFTLVFFTIFLIMTGSGYSAPPASSSKTTTAPASAQPATDTRLLSQEEQDQGAKKIFEKMYELGGTISPEQYEEKRVEMYKEIITKYPKSGLAQEAHWKLCRIYLRETTPPKITEAEKVYQDYVANYSSSVLVTEIQNEFIRYFSVAKMWDRLLIFTAAIIEKDPDNPPAFPLYYYAEANYQLERREEAEAAFVLAAKIIPKSSSLNKLAVERLTKMGVPIPTPDTPASLKRTISK